MESIIVRNTKPAVSARHRAVAALIKLHQPEFDLLLAGEKAKIQAPAPVSVPSMPSQEAIPVPSVPQQGENPGIDQ